jgi:hypothetical protein
MRMVRGVLDGSTFENKTDSGVCESELNSVGRSYGRLSQRIRARNNCETVVGCFLCKFSGLY